MAFVLDASVSAAWVLPDEEDRRAEHVHDLLAEVEVFVPAIWWLETRNLIVTGERRGRFSRQQADEAMVLLDSYPVVIDTEPPNVFIVNLARRRQLTIYDATYVELALRTALPLATLDRPMAAAAAAEGVDLLIAP